MSSITRPFSPQVTMYNADSEPVSQNHLQGAIMGWRLFISGQLRVVRAKVLPKPTQLLSSSKLASYRTLSLHKNPALRSSKRSLIVQCRVHMAVPAQTSRFEPRISSIYSLKRWCRHSIICQYTAVSCWSRAASSVMRCFSHPCRPFPAFICDLASLILNIHGLQRINFILGELFYGSYFLSRLLAGGFKRTSLHMLSKIQSVPYTNTGFYLISILAN